MLLVHRHFLRVSRVLAFLVKYTWSGYGRTALITLNLILLCSSMVSDMSVIVLSENYHSAVRPKLTQCNRLDYSV